MNRSLKIFFNTDFFTKMRGNWSTDYKFNAKPACRRGRELDNETGLYYYGARYYTPELSIWLSACPPEHMRRRMDPLSDKYPSMSPFMYCAGNPVRLIDPNGMEIETSIARYKTMKDGSERRLNSISLRRADRIEITHTVKSIKMYDATGTVGSDAMTSAASQIQNEISNYWNTNGEITNRRGQRLSVNTVFENDIEVAQDRSQISRKDHVIAVASESWIRGNKGGSGQQMTLDGIGANILYTSPGWLGTYGGDWAHEFGHMGGLDDVRFMRGEIHKQRLMYNGSPSFRGMMPAPPTENPMPMPHYKEFRRLNFGNTSYYTLPKSIY